MNIKNILFDIGNVLAPDYWESLWLTKDLGLADRLGIPLQLAKSTGKKLWSRYSRTIANETDYWADFASAIGIPIPQDLIREVEGQVIIPNPFAKEALLKIAAAEIPIGLISNNTSFWAPKQLALLDFDGFDPKLRFLSHELGVLKREDFPDLYALAARIVDPTRTLIIDDRPKNIIFAAKMGFMTQLYGNQDCVDVESGDYYEASPYVPFGDVV